MRVLSIECSGFRNIEHIKADMFCDMNVICGENAQGKTNLLESIWLFTGMKSFRGAKDADFIKFGKEAAALKLNFIAGGIENDAQIKISDKKTAFLNNNKLKSAAALAGNFNAIVFSPDDLNIVSGGPQLRRRFADIGIGQLYPSYIGVLRNYTRAVTQRNRIIKDYRYDGSLSVMLDVFEEEIAANGVKIESFRKRYLKALNEFLPTVYGGISSKKEELSTEYISSAENLRESLLNSRKEDMLSGVTSVGPHRDDIEFKINGIRAKGFASQGQKRSIALSLKLAEAEVINKISGEYPVFLLDDVMSELDPERQNYVLNHIKGIQSFITCCDPSNTAQLKKGKIIRVKNGQVS